MNIVLAVLWRVKGGLYSPCNTKFRSVTSARREARNIDKMFAKLLQNATLK